MGLLQNDVMGYILHTALLVPLTSAQSFALNCAMLGTATVLQLVLMKRRLNLQSMAGIKTESMQQSSSSSSAPVTEEEKASLTNSSATASTEIV